MILRVPRDAPRIVTWVGGRIKQHHDTIQIALRGRKDLHKQVAGVPIAQGFANIQTILHAGTELFRPCQIIAQQFQRRILDVGPKTFDGNVFGGPAALTKGIPGFLPPNLLPAFRSSLQLTVKLTRVQENVIMLQANLVQCKDEQIQQIGTVVSESVEGSLKELKSYSQAIQGRTHKLQSTINPVTLQNVL